MSASDAEWLLVRTAARLREVEHRGHGALALPADILTIERGTQEPVPSGQAPPVTDRLISIREIRQMFGLGRTAAYELTHRPGFPTPVRISSRCYRWWENENEVVTFAASLRDKGQADRGGAAPQPTSRQAPSAWGTSTLRITGTVRMARSRGKTQ